MARTAGKQRLTHVQYRHSNYHQNREREEEEKHDWVRRGKLEDSGERCLQCRLLDDHVVIGVELLAAAAGEAEEEAEGLHAHTRLSRAFTPTNPDTAALAPR